MNNNNDKSYVNWYCRRGLLELDLILFFFIKNKYDLLNERKKLIFKKLLLYEDIDLFNLIFLKHNTTNSEINYILKIIRNCNVKFT